MGTYRTVNLREFTSASAACNNGLLNHPMRHFKIAGLCSVCAIFYRVSFSGVLLPTILYCCVFLRFIGSSYCQALYGIIVYCCIFICMPVCAYVSTCMHVCAFGKGLGCMSSIATAVVLLAEIMVMSKVSACSK